MTDQAGDNIDRMYEAVRKSVGKMVPIRQHNTAASADAIRQFANGCGDDNPLWLDPEYAATTCWGANIAPPTFVMSCGFPRSTGMPGVHGLWTGIDLSIPEPVLLDTPIKVMAGVASIEEKPGRYTGRQFRQHMTAEYRDPSGKLLAQLTSHVFRVVRSAGAATDKFKEIERAHYTREDMAAIAVAYAREIANRRGSKPRLWSQVSVGDNLPELLKGPLSLTDNVSWTTGQGGPYLMAHRNWYSYLARHSKAGMLDDYGVPDSPERVHWENEAARKIGMPIPFDSGPQRVAWMVHCVTDWMGDSGWVRRIQANVAAPNFLGDLSRVNASVTAKFGESDYFVQVDVTCTDQRGRVTATAKIDVVLPLK